MRLIDAEKLKERLIDGYSSVPQTIKKEHPLMNRAHIELIDAIDSIPEVDVLEQIRAEIEQERDKVYQNRQGCDTYYADGLDTALEIIDKYRG